MTNNEKSKILEWLFVNDHNAQSSRDWREKFIKMLERLLDEQPAKVFCENTAGLTKINTDILSLIKSDLTISKTDGKRTIYQAKQTFKSYIDKDFKDWELDVKQGPTKEIKVNVFEAVKDFKFIDIFINPEEQAMTQSQIINFCEEYPTWLREEGYATFFLTKVGGEYFVVYVFVHSGGLLVDVRRLESGHVLHGEYHFRVVSPQL